MQQEVALGGKKKCYTASRSQESTCVLFSTHFHPADILAAPQSSQGSAGKTDSLARARRALTVPYNTETDKRVSQPVCLPYLP